MKTKELIKEIDKFDWFLYITRSLDMLTLIANARARGKDIHKELGFSRIKDMLFIFENGLVKYYYDINQYRLFNKKISNLINDNPDKILKILKKAEIINSEINKETSDQEEQIKILKRKKLIELGNIFTNKFRALQYNFIPCLIVPYFAGVVEEEKLLKDNKKINRIKILSKKLRLKSHYSDSRNIIIENILNEIADRTNVKKELVELLTPEEIVSLCQGGPIKKEEILNREKNYIYFVSEKEEYLISDNIKNIINKIKVSNLNKKSAEDDNIKGQIAYRGKVRGIAKVVYNSKDFSKFKEGDILLTINSNPSLMPVIKKCSAIVSDEGGITSHASVISRELKKPCIIGTKIATQVLKDGDEIEVDANAGMVKIIKKANDR